MDYLIATMEKSVCNVRSKQFKNGFFVNFGIILSVLNLIYEYIRLRMRTNPFKIPFTVT
jgi:hypothetical protein